eukprot:GHVL01037468.1.p1 GENE.GHVL01037468.1~~GHVL01037468.1.p1  ORF type:complete len:604 (-),score=122.70 GHVL01037468.1:185-1996(-)
MIKAVISAAIIASPGFILPKFSVKTNILYENGSNRFRLDCFASDSVNSRRPDFDNSRRLKDIKNIIHERRNITNYENMYKMSNRIIPKFSYVKPTKAPIVEKKVVEEFNMYDAPDTIDNMTIPIDGSEEIIEALLNHTNNSIKIDLRQDNVFNLLHDSMKDTFEYIRYSAFKPKWTQYPVLRQLPEPEEFNVLPAPNRRLSPAGRKAYSLLLSFDKKETVKSDLGTSRKEGIVISEDGILVPNKQLGFSDVSKYADKSNEIFGNIQVNELDPHPNYLTNPQVFPQFHKMRNYFVETRGVEVLRMCIGADLLKLETLPDLLPPKFPQPKIQESKSLEDYFKKKKISDIIKNIRRDASPWGIAPEEMKPSSEYSTAILNLKLRHLFQRHLRDTGSPELQISVLSARIQRLKEHIEANKQDKVARRKIVIITSRRKRHLTYLFKTDKYLYKTMIERLALPSVEKIGLNSPYHPRQRFEVYKYRKTKKIPVKRLTKSYVTAMNIIKNNLPLELEELQKENITVSIFHKPKPPITKERQHEKKNKFTLFLLNQIEYKKKLMRKKKKSVDMTPLIIECATRRHQEERFYLKFREKTYNERYDPLENNIY